MKLTVDRLVVYAGHGVGRVVSKTHRAIGGVEQEVVAIEFGEGLSMSIPIERAQSHMRALATKAELLVVGETLRQPSPDDQRRWLIRKNETLARLASGSVLDLATIIRDTAPRARGGARTKFTGNTSEREVFVKACELLSSEIGHIRGVGSAKAQDWIDEQLAQG